MTNEVRAPVLRVFRSGEGWRWHLIAGQRKRVAVSGETFASREEARTAAKTAKMLMKYAATVEFESDRPPA